MIKNREYLKYVIGNCKEALIELCDVNQKLKDSIKFESELNSNRLGMLNRVLRDYLVVRVSGLFDKDSRTISFVNSSCDIKKVDEIRQEEIIRKLTKERNKGVSHSEKQYVTSEDIQLYTYEIINSNLKDLLIKLELILENNKLN